MKWAAISELGPVVTPQCTRPAAGKLPAAGGQQGRGDLQWPPPAPALELGCGQLRPLQRPAAKGGHQAWRRGTLSRGLVARSRLRPWDVLGPQRERVHPHDHPSTSPPAPAAQAPRRLEGRGFLVGAWLPRWLRRLAATKAERAGRLGRRRLERARRVGQRADRGGVGSGYSRGTIGISNSLPTRGYKLAHSVLASPFYHLRPNFANRSVWVPAFLSPPQP